MEAFGRRAEAAAADDEASAVALVRLDDSVGDAEALREFERGGLFGDERVGAAFEQEAFAPVGADRAARARRGFEQENLCTGLGGGRVLFLRA